MSYRDPGVWLDPAEARCNPSALPQCGRFTCGRYKAMIPQGTPLADFNRDRNHNGPVCKMWISAELKPPAPVAGRPVFKPLISWE